MEAKQDNSAAEDGLERLVRRYQESKIPADFDEIFQRIESLVLTRIEEALQQENEDVFQEVMLAIHENIHSFRGDVPFMRWAYGIIRNKVADEIRRKQRERGLAHRVAAAADEFRDAVEGVAAQAMNFLRPERVEARWEGFESLGLEARRERVAEILKQLPVDCRVLLTWRLLEEATFDEIHARLLGDRLLTHPTLSDLVPTKSAIEAKLLPRKKRYERVDKRKRLRRIYSRTDVCLGKAGFIHEGINHEPEES